MDPRDNPNITRESGPTNPQGQPPRLGAARQAYKPGPTEAQRANANPGGPPQGTPEGPQPELVITRGVLQSTADALSKLDWSHGGLSRDQIKKAYPGLSPAVYLRLPATKHFASPTEVMHDVGDAESRAEGEYLGANPDIPEAESLDQGGPPAWGSDPLYSIGGIENSGSAEDTEGLEESNTP